MVEIADNIDELLSVRLEIGAEFVRLWRGPNEEVRTHRPDVTPSLSALTHDEWHTAHLWSALPRASAADFTSIAHSLDVAVIDSGRALATTFLPQAVQERLAELIAGCAGTGTTLRLGLHITDEYLAPGLAISALPWEALSLSEFDQPIALLDGIQFFRLVGAFDNSASDDFTLFPRFAYPSPIRLMATFPGPSNARGATLDLSGEMSRIVSVCTSPEALQRVEPVLIDPSAEAITTVLQGGNRHFVHISSHGNAASVEVETPYGYVGELSSKLLSDALEHSDQADLPPVVFINSCLSGAVIQADLSPMQALAGRGITTVIGMRAPVSDRFAAAFAECFYASLVANNPTSVVGAFCDARAIIAEELRLAVTEGQAVVSAEWATPVLLIRRDVIFIDSERTTGRMSPRASGNTGQSDRFDLRVRRAPIQRHLRNDILTVGGRPHVYYGTAGCGKTTEVDLALEAASHLIAFCARVNGRQGVGDVTAAVVSALRSPTPYVLEGVGQSASELADALDAGVMGLGQGLSRIDELLLTRQTEQRFLIVWDSFEDNLEIIEERSEPVAPRFLLRDVDVWRVLNRPEAASSRVRCLLVSRYLFSFDDRQPQDVVNAFNVGPMTKQESDQLIDLVAATTSDEQLKQALWQRLGGHPLGTSQAVRLLRGRPSGELPSVLRRVTVDLQMEARLDDIVARLSPHAIQLAICACVFQVPVPTGSLIWAMFSLGPAPDAATARRFQRLVEIMSETEISDSRVTDNVLYDWTREELDEESREHLEEDLRSDPWLQLSRRGELEAIHELLSTGILAVDLGQHLDETLDVLAPRFVAEYFAERWPEQTRSDHLRAMLYWLGPVDPA